MKCSKYKVTCSKDGTHLFLLLPSPVWLYNDDEIVIDEYAEKYIPKGEMKRLEKIEDVEVKKLANVTFEVIKSNFVFLIMDSILILIIKY